MRLERPADEQLALRSVLLWLGLSCADDHRYCDDDDQADNYHDHSDDRVGMMIVPMLIMTVIIMTTTMMIEISARITNYKRG